MTISWIGQSGLRTDLHWFDTYFLKAETMKIKKQFHAYSIVSQGPSSSGFNVGYILNNIKSGMFRPLNTLSRTDLNKIVLHHLKAPYEKIV